MSAGRGSGLGIVRQSAMLAISGFMLMSSLAALGSGLESPEPTPSALESKAWQDSSAQLARPDYGVDTARQAERTTCPLGAREVDADWLAAYRDVDG